MTEGAQPEDAQRGAVPHVVILGAGFGGLAAARALGNKRVRITIIDRRNHHVFQPLLYQVATAGLSPGEIAYPIRSIVRRQRNTQVWLAEAKEILPERRIVRLADGEVGYDYLIVAVGARHSYFGHPEWEPIAPGLKALEDALEIRRKILLAFERAERETDAERRRALLTFAIVGAGPTGVELAGAIADIARRVMVEDFRAIDPREARIVLLEGGERVLPAFSPHLSERAEAALCELGVEVHTRAMVTEIAETSLTYRTQEGSAALATTTILWAAGVQPSPLARSLGVPLDKSGHVQVNRDCSLSGHRDVFVIGDLAALDDMDGRRLPGLAPVAIQQGKQTAANIVRDIQGQSRRSFRYLDKGNLATIGRARAVAEIGKLELSGWTAWVVWIFVHILYLIGFRNRLLVATEWAWDYLSFQRAARLITNSPKCEPGSEGNSAVRRP